MNFYVKRFSYTLVTACILLISKSSSAQWPTSYNHDVHFPSTNIWLDSTSYLITNCLLEDYGKTLIGSRRYGTYFPLKRNELLYISLSNYIIYDLFGNKLGTSQFTTAADTGEKAVIESFGLYINPNCWMHLMARKNGSISCRISRNQGSSWHDAPAPNLTHEYGLSYAYAEKFSYYTIDSCIWIYSGLTADSLYRSTDLGKSWETILLPDWLKPAVYHSIAFSSSQNGLMTCFNDGKLAKTTDGGKTWSKETVLKPNVISSRLCYAKPSASHEGFYALYGNDGCYFSTSEGQWWSKMDDLRHELITFYNADYGFSFRYDGLSVNAIRPFQNNLRTSLENPFGTSTIRVYPNPTSSYIHTDELENSLAVIFTPQGKEVLRSFHFNSEQPIDIKALPMETYLLWVPEHRQSLWFIKE